MPGEQNFKVYLTFKDDATGKFTKATNDQISAIKKLGVAVKKEGSAAAVDLDKMGIAHDKVGRAARFHNAEIGKLAGSIGSLRNMILVWMFALRPLINSIKETTQAAMEQEDALKRMTFALEMQGVATETTKEYLIDLSKEFQRTTRYSNDAIMQLMDSAMAMGNIMPHEIERVIQATLDLSTKTGKDLSTSINILNKAAQGIVPTFRELRIEIDKNIPSGEVLETVLKKIKERMGGAAQEDIKSFRGQLEQTKNEFNETKATVGNAIIKLAEYLGIISSIKKASKDMMMVLSTPETNLDKLNKELWEVEKHIEKISKPKVWGANLLPWNILPTGDKSKTFYEENRKNILLAIEQEKKLQKEAIQSNAVEEKRMKTQLEFREKYEAILLKDPKIRLARLNEEFATFKAGFEDNAKALLEIDIWYKNEKDILDIEILKNAKTHSDMYVLFMQGAARGMKDAISNGFIKIVKGEFEGLQDVVVEFGNVMIEVLLQMAALKIVKSSFLGAFLGAHTGGYLLSTDNSFGYRKKFHSGGEVPATLLEGEGVLNRTGMRSLGVDNLNKLNRGEGTGSGQTVNNYYIQTIDERSFRERLQQHGDIYAGASDSSIRDNGILRKTTQRWGS